MTIVHYLNRVDAAVDADTLRTCIEEARKDKSLSHYDFHAVKEHAIRRGASLKTKHRTTAKNNKTLF